MTNPQFDAIAARLGELRDKLAETRDPNQRVLLLKQMRETIQQAETIIQQEPTNPNFNRS